MRSRDDIGRPELYLRRFYAYFLVRLVLIDLITIVVIVTHLVDKLSLGVQPTPERV